MHSASKYTSHLACWGCDVVAASTVVSCTACCASLRIKPNHLDCRKTLDLAAKKKLKNEKNVKRPLSLCVYSNQNMVHEFSVLFFTKQAGPW